MSAAGLALLLYAVYGLVAFVLRSLMQLRRTGDSGFRGLSGRPGSAEWFAGIGFFVAIAIGVLAPVLARQGVVEPIGALDSEAGHALGAALAIAGILATFAAQVRMGASWRVGVDPSERTELVTDGPFARVRNPIFSFLLLTATGLALLVPSWVALAGLAWLVAAVQLQVRSVEEPYLLRTHREAYARYAARVGRFIPGVGRLG